MNQNIILTLCAVALLGLGLAPTAAADALDADASGSGYNCVLTVGSTGVVCLGYWYCTESYCVLPTCLLRDPDVCIL